MPNTILTPDKITREALRILHQELNFIGNINRQYDDSFAKSGAKIGDTLRIRMPAQYTVRDGWARSAQDHIEENITLTVQNVKGVDVDFTSAELTLDLDDFAERHLKPAMSVLAANVEADALTMAKDVPSVIAVPGSAITYKNIIEGRKALVDSLSPQNGLKTLLNTQDNVDLVDALKGLFNPQQTVSMQYTDGYMGKTGGFDFFENTLLPRFTSGDAGLNTGYLTNGVIADGATALVVDTGTSTLVKGDVITIDGVNAVHPETKADLGYLKKFVVTADVSASATSIPVWPAVHSTGGRKNVSVTPPNNSAVRTFLGSNATVDESLQFHRDAFTFATADIEMPRGVDMASRQVHDGISLSFVRDFDVDSRDFKGRFDILYGYKTLRPQFACRQWHN